MHGLLTSRKFWLTVVAIAGTIAMAVVKELSVKDAIMAIQIQLVTLVGAIAIEDHGRGVKNVAAAGDVTVNEAPHDTPANDVKPMTTPRESAR